MADAGTIIISLIARTAAFERGMKRSSSVLSKFERSFRTTQRMLTGGAIGYAVKGLAGGGANFLEALREGEDAGAAFSRGLPIVGSMVQSFENLYAQVGGFAGQMENLNLFVSAQEKLNSLVA